MQNNLLVTLISEPFPSYVHNILSNIIQLLTMEALDMM